MIYRHCKKPPDGELKEGERIDSGIGRLFKLSRVDHRNIRKVNTYVEGEERLFHVKACTSCKWA